MNDRSIKLRVWDVDSKFFYTKDFILTDEGKIKVLCRGNPYIGDEPFWRDVYSEIIIQQFTGLVDEKGREIYEGDILSVYQPHSDKYLWGEVIWINEYYQYFVKFQVGEECFSTELKYIDKDWRLIGNICQNKNCLDN